MAAPALTTRALAMRLMRVAPASTAASRTRGLLARRNISPLRPLLPTRRRRGAAERAASGDSGGSTPQFQGVYGPWTMEPADYIEVYAYRACLAAAALAGAAAAAEMLFSPAGDAGTAPLPLDLLLAGGALSLGAALVLVHVYITPLKRAMQALWLAGVLGAAWIAATASDASSSATTSSSVLAHVASHPWPDILLIGPLAASATGVAVKEGFCFRRPEAAAVALLLPALCLTHWLSAAYAPASGAVPVFGSGAALAAVALALGKAMQDPKGDVGDKSIFEFRKLGEAERERVLRELRAADEAALRAEAAALARERLEQQQREEKEEGQ